MPGQPVRKVTASPGAAAGPIAPPAIERNDDYQIEESVRRLERRYTREQISIAELTSRVRTFYGGFASARIRSFVSIFVERLVRRSIETPPAKP
jgi:hypothetical protein